MSRDRMDTVLRVRRIAQQRALAEVAATTQDLAVAEAAEQAAQDLLGSYVSRARSTGELGIARAAGIALRHGVEVTSGERRGADARRSRAVGRWQEARTHERAVERLVERRQRVAVLAAQAAEQARLDELALLLRARGTA
jgi:hypothetical protein